MPCFAYGIRHPKAPAIGKGYTGIVQQVHSYDSYLSDQASWLKIRNRSYSQWEGREQLFERERETDPDLTLWDDCVSTGAELDYAKL